MNLIRPLFAIFSLRVNLGTHLINAIVLRQNYVRNQIKSSRKVIKMIHCNFIETDANKNKRKMHASNLCRNCIISE